MNKRLLKSPYHGSYKVFFAKYQPTTSFKIVLFLGLFLMAGHSWGQLFQQNFNSSTTVADYVNATSPANGQFNVITSGTTNVATINSGTLRYIKSGSTSSDYRRTTDFSPTPSAIMYRFDLTLTGNTIAQSGATNSPVWQVGSSFSNSVTAEVNANVHSRIGFNWTTIDGQFSLREIEGATSTINFNGTQTITWVINNSGSTLTYKAPDGSFELVANDKFDVWIGTTKGFDEKSATTVGQTLTDIKFAFPSGSQNATIDIDNLLIDPIPLIPNSAAATLITSSGFTANWTAVSGVTGYRLDVSTSSNFADFVTGYNNLYINGQASNSFEVTGLNPLTTYYYRVRGASQYAVAEFAGGNSISQNLTTLPAPSSTITFTGNTSEFWNLASNWTPAIIPTADYHVSIPDGKSVTIASAATCNNLTVSPTASFTIHSDATNSGSLIINGTSSGNITYNRYLTGGNQWHFISPPVNNQNIESFVLSGANAIAKNAGKYGVAPYNNAGEIGKSTWAFWDDGSGTNPINTAGNFITGKGYQILRTADGLVSFTGTTPTTTVTQALNIGTHATSGTNAWNLIGNPFPAAIAANTPAQTTHNFLAVNSAAMDASYVALYLWNPATSTYTAINQLSPTTHIAPGQGFFVKAAVGGGSVNFTPAMRTLAASSFQRIAADELPRISLVAETQTGATSSTDIKYMEGATLGLDPGFDAGRFGATTSSFGVYSRLVQDNGVDFALQVVPDHTFDTTIIPIGLDAPAGTQVTFKASYANLPIDTKVYLEDRLLGTYAELNADDKAYTITLTSISKGDGRFYLRTTDPSGTLSIKGQEAVGIKIIPMYGNKQIKVAGPMEYPATIAVYDLLGRVMLSETLKKENNNEVSVPQLNNGIYLVKVTTAEQQFSAKIAWY